MKLYLVRHGQALGPAEDPAQPLSGEGRADITRLARTIGNLNLRVGSIFHSGKLRAEETARLICLAMNPRPRVRAAGGLAPGDDIGPALELIGSAAGDLLLVSHLPLLDTLLAALVRPPREADELPSFEAGTLVGLDQVGDCWEIFRVLGPRMLL